MNYSSFSQTAIKTVSVSKDSIVVLPKQLVTYMVQDLIRYDGLKERMEVANTNTELLKKQVSYAEKQNEELQRKIIGLAATNKEYQLIDELNTKTIDIYKTKSAKMKRQRNAFIYFSCAALIGILVK